MRTEHGTDFGEQDVEPRITRRHPVAQLRGIRVGGPVHDGELAYGAVASPPARSFLKASSNTPTEGWEVRGNWDEAFRPRKNSSPVRSTWSRKTWSPKWTLSGTTVMPAACCCSSVRSAVASVTIRTTTGV